MVIWLSIVAAWGKKHVENNDYSRSTSSNARSPNSLPPLGTDRFSNRAKPVSAVLREISGNDVCAECNAPEPDWASLNLGILLCIECSGVHRNLGVHISKVRFILQRGRDLPFSFLY